MVIYAWKLVNLGVILENMGYNPDYIAKISNYSAFLKTG